MLKHIIGYTRLLVATVLAFVALGAQADEGKSYSKQMNELKRSGDYVYAETSGPNESDAKAACDALLKIEITKHLVSVGAIREGEDRIIKDISAYDRKYLVQPRGEMFRVFGYVSKYNIGASGDKTAEVLESGAGGNQKPMPEQATKSNPEIKQTAEESTLPVAQTASESTASSAAEIHTDGLHLSKWQIDMLASIAKEKNMADARKVLNRFRSQNRIKRIGDRSVSNPRPADSFYLVFGDSGAWVAFLAPSESDSHFDMLSGSVVKIDGYRSNQLLWFQISK